jgi:hypothetical protein
MPQAYESLAALSISSMFEFITHASLETPDP